MKISNPIVITALFDNPVRGVIEAGSDRKRVLKWLLPNGWILVIHKIHLTWKPGIRYHILLDGYEMVHESGLPFDLSEGGRYMLVVEKVLEIQADNETDEDFHYEIFVEGHLRKIGNQD